MQVKLSAMTGPLVLVLGLAVGNMVPAIGWAQSEPDKAESEQPEEEKKAEPSEEEAPKSAPESESEAKSEGSEGEATPEPPPEVPAEPPAPLPKLQPPPVEVPPPTEVPEVAPPVPTPEAPAEVADQPSADVEELMVTGSRIRRSDLTTPAPIAIIDTKTINNSGLVSIGQILQNLPAQSNAINVQFNNGGDGSTRVNLRGLGAARTLVLLNGRRVVPGGTGANASVDLNAIPVEIIERVEVLKDGASAVYGSDAIGGVVNIITKKDFSGVEAASYYGASQHGGQSFNASITAGETTERASFLLSFQYFRQEPLFAGARDFSKSDLAFDWPNGAESTLGSSAPPQGLIIAGRGGGNAAWDDLSEKFPDGPPLWFNDEDEGWRQAQLTGNSDVGEGDFYNYQPENYLVTPSERYSLFAQGQLEITEKIRLYAEALYTNRQSDQLLAPEPVFIAFIGDGLTYSGDNVYNPFGRDFGDVRRRMVEGGNRNFLQDVSTYRMVLGLEGDFPDDWGRFSTWKWDFNFNFGRTVATNVTEGQYIASRLQNAIGPSFFDAGVARCGTPGNVIAGCVPLNLFGGPGTITPEMLNYITYSGVDRGFNEQRLFTFETGGEIFELWDRPAGLVLGLQQRREAGGDLPDSITAIGDSTGNNRTPTEGSYDEYAVYTELVVPVLADLPAVELFELQAALRVFNFNTFGTDFMYKLGGLWKVYSDVNIRATYSRAFRAPNVGELFQGASDSNPAVNDPCDVGFGRTPTADENCRLDGVPDDLNAAQTQLRTIVGGNPLLDPETANVLTAGLVWEPSFSESLKGLSLTLDYFNVAIDESIQPVGASIILNNCYQKTGAERSNCEQIFRNVNGVITRIDDLQVNSGGVRTSGMDAAIRYSRGTGVGRFGGNFDVTWVHKYDEIQPDGTKVSGLGQYDLTTNTKRAMFPAWRFNATFQWAKDGLGAGTNIRFLTSIRECENNNCEEGTATRKVDANVTIDLFASYAFSSSAGYTSLRAGINNIADQEPPIIYNGFLANSDAANYDYLGRYFYIGVSHKL